MWKLIILGKKTKQKKKPQNPNIECSRFHTVNNGVFLLTISTSDKVLNECRKAAASFLHRISYFCNTHILFYSVTQLCEK